MSVFKISAILVAVTTQFSSVQVEADPTVAEVGSYALLRGEIEDCPRFPGVLGAPRVDASGDIEFLSYGKAHVLGLTEPEIRSVLVGLILENRFPKSAPNSLSVEILLTEQQYRIARGEILRGVSFLANPRCESSPTLELEEGLDIDSRGFRIARIDA